MFIYCLFSLGGLHKLIVWMKALRFLVSLVFLDACINKRCKCRVDVFIHGFHVSFNVVIKGSGFSVNVFYGAVKVRSC